MDSDALKPILAGIVRHFLTSAGGALVAGGYIQSSDTSAFIGGGMVVAGIAWSWWQKEGQDEVAALLKKMTATRTKADAVKVAEVLPPAAAVDTKVKAVSAESVVAKGAAVVLLLLTASVLWPANAFAQTARREQPQINLPIDPLHLNSTKITGDINKDAQAIWQKVIASSLDDLNYAAAMAKNANTQTSLVRLQCVNAMITLVKQSSGADLKNPDGTPMVKPDAHLITDVESLAEVIDNLSPQGPLFVACSGAAQLAKTNVLSFINAVVTGAAGLATMPIIPGL